MPIGRARTGVHPGFQRAPNWAGSIATGKVREPERQRGVRWTPKDQWFGDADGTLKDGRSRSRAPRADEASVGVILLSIKPVFIERVLRGEKRVEFRRRASARLAGMPVLMYATSPTCLLVARARVGDVRRAPARALWAAYRDSAGIDRAGLLEYFEGCSAGWGLELDAVEPLATPRDLAWLRARGANPPMSYSIIEERWARELAGSKRAA